MNTKNNGNKGIILLMVSLLAILILFAIDVAVGSADISVKEFIRIVLGRNVDMYDRSIVFDIRLPRVISAVLVGSGLSIAGVLLQTLFKNPLAGPYVLGISSGAGLGVAIYTLASASILAHLPILQVGGQLFASLFGAAFVFVLVMMASWKITNSVSLLIIGMMVGSLANSIVGVLQYFSSPDKTHRYVVWTLGSLDGIDWGKLYWMAPLMLVLIGASVLLVKPLNAMLMGESNAKLAGVKVKRTRILIVIISSMLVGVVTSYAGPIAFIGMTVPHIARLITNKISFYTLLPSVVIIGSILMLICDIISQLPGYATTLPINSVTALFGAPLVVFLILHNRRVKIS